MTHYFRRPCDGCGERIARSRPDGGFTRVRSRYTSAIFCRNCAVNGLPPIDERPTREELEMATTEAEATTKEAAAPGSNWVRNADESEEATLEANVRPLFEDVATQGAAMRYGRKLLRKAAGKRASAPPLTGLTYDQAVSVANALGVEAPQKREKTTKAKTKKASSERQAKSDPKPSARKKTSAAS